jgi:DUF1009 family protein
MQNEPSPQVASEKQCSEDEGVVAVESDMVDVAGMEVVEEVELVEEVEDEPNSMQSAAPSFSHTPGTHLAMLVVGSTGHLSQPL